MLGVYIKAKFQNSAKFTSQVTGFQICAIGVAIKSLFAEPVTYIILRVHNCRGYECIEDVVLYVTNFVTFVGCNKTCDISDISSKKKTKKN